MSRLKLCSYTTSPPKLHRVVLNYVRGLSYIVPNQKQWNWITSCWITELYILLIITTSSLPYFIKDTNVRRHQKKFTPTPPKRFVSRFVLNIPPPFFARPRCCIIAWVSQVVFFHDTAGDPGPATQPYRFLPQWWIKDWKGLPHTVICLGFTRGETRFSFT